MKLIADKEAVDLLTQASDAILKAYGNKGLGLANQLLAKTEHMENFEFTEKKESKVAGEGK